jgi:hypothetical protein
MSKSHVPHVRVCILLLIFACSAQHVNSQKRQGVIDTSTEAISERSDREEHGSIASRLEHNVRFRCGVSSSEPTNQAFRVALKYFNEGHDVVVIRFRLRVQINDDSPSYYEASSNQSLEPGNEREYAVSILPEANTSQEALVAEPVHATLIECRVEKLQICPVAIAESANGVSQANSTRNLDCTPEISITQKLKFPPDKKWNCFDVDDGGKRCEILARPSDNCLATICMADMVWMTRPRQWVAFDGVDWTSCNASDPYEDPQELWNQCANVIRKKQTEFTPGEYIPLSQATDAALLQQEPK